MSDVTILSERQRKMVSFALWMFATSARERADAAAQDKDGLYFKPGAFMAFMDDAKDAEELLHLMRGDAPLMLMPKGDAGVDAARNTVDGGM